jgi:hypothetical protein
MKLDDATIWELATDEQANLLGTLSSEHYDMVMRQVHITYKEKGDEGIFAELKSALGV